MSSKVRFGLAALAAASSLLSAAELKPATVAAWNEYIRNADSRAVGRIRDGRPLGPSKDAGQTARLRGGEILVSPMADPGILHLPDGLIHDWFGAIFIPGATVEDLFAVEHDYDRYKEFFAPTVADSKALACRGTEQKFSMVWRRKVLFVNAALRGEYEARDFEVDPRVWYSIAEMTKAQEIEDYGQPAERLLPPDQGTGFLWRLHSIARYEERDGGVFVELEAIALSRDIPPSLSWLVRPVVARLSRNSLMTSLRQTRDAVQARPEWLSAANVKSPAPAAPPACYR